MIMFAEPPRRSRRVGKVALLAVLGLLALVLIVSSVDWRLGDVGSIRLPPDEPKASPPAKTGGGAVPDPRSGASQGSTTANAPPPRGEGARPDASPAPPVANAPPPSRQTEAPSRQPDTTARPTPGLPAFPWPPPKYSAFAEIPREWIAPRGSETLASVARRLEYAFDEAGYGERSYFWIPGGFALASRIEEIRDDASPFPPPRRWSANIDKPPQGFFDYVRALFDARPGLYRVIVFAVTNVSFSAAPKAPTSGEATRWMYEGLMQLPDEVGSNPYSNGHRTTALIYEFERRPDDREARVRQPSGSPGRVHLQRAGLAQALSQR